MCKQGWHLAWHHIITMGAPATAARRVHVSVCDLWRVSGQAPRKEGPWAGSQGAQSCATGTQTAGSGDPDIRLELKNCLHLVS